MAKAKIYPVSVGSEVIQARNPCRAIDANTIGIALFDRKGRQVGEALIDAEDLYRAAEWRWSMQRHGYVRTFWRGMTWGNSLHRLVMNAHAGQQLDHINRNPLDNRKVNLRFVDYSIQAQNKGAHVDGTSTYRGVALVAPGSTKPWRASVCIDGQIYDLGTYRTEEGAACAAKRFRLRNMPGAID